MSTEKFTYTEEVTGEIVNIPVKLLHHHHANPRGQNYGDLSELTASIKANGILQNLTVVPFWFDTTGVGCDDPKQQADMGYLVVIGNRRLEAAKAAGLETLPCIIARMSKSEQVQTMLLENMQREDLTVIEQAFGFQMMLDFGDSVADIAEKTGFSQSTVRRRVKLMELDHDKLKKFEGAQFSLEDVDKLNKIESIEKRNELLEFVGTPNFSFKLKSALDAQEYDKKHQAVMDYLHEKGCEPCPKRVFGYKYESFGIMDGLTKKLKEAVNKYVDLCKKDSMTPYYRDYYGSISLVYLAADGTSSDEREEKAAKERAIRDLKSDMMKKTNHTVWQLRFDFIKNYGKAAAKKNFKVIVALFAKSYAIFDHGTDDDMRLLLGMPAKDYEGSADDMSAAIDKLAETNPELLILYLFYLTLDDGPQGGYLNTWLTNGSYFDPNEDLDKIYDNLEKLGYQISDGEKELQNGTSPLQNPDNMVYKLEVEKDTPVPLDKFLTDVRTFNVFKRAGVSDSEDLIVKEKSGKLSAISDEIYNRAIDMAKKNGVILPRRKTDEK